MVFIYYFINPIWSRAKDDDNLLSRDDLIRLHGEGFQQGEINNEDVNEINSNSLRDLYEEYLEVLDRNTGFNEWATRAGLVSRVLRLEFNVLGLIMIDNFTDNSIPLDEFIISFQNLFSLIRTITEHHTQYYIFFQLIYRGRRIAESERMGIINSEEARHSRVYWKMNVIMILSYYDLTACNKQVVVWCGGKFTRRKPFSLGFKIATNSCRARERVAVGDHKGQKARRLWVAGCGLRVVGCGLRCLNIPKHTTIVYV
ncbi:hypothetical protein QTP88_000576 [Uroleucon formosanum]